MIYNAHLSNSPSINLIDIVVNDNLMKNIEVNTLI